MGTNVIQLDVEAERLDVAFGLGRELVVVNQTTAEEGTASLNTCTWSFPSPTARHVAFVSARSTQQLSEPLPVGYADASSANVSAVAATLSKALLLAAAQQSIVDDEALETESFVSRLQAAVWDLIKLLFIDTEEAYIAEPMAEWACTHAVALQEDLPMSVASMYDEVMSSLQRHDGAFPGADSLRLFWKVMQQCLLTGMLTEAAALIESTSVVTAGSEDLSAAEAGRKHLLLILHNVVTSMPRWTGQANGGWLSRGEFDHARTQWLAMLMDVLDSSAEDLLAKEPAGVIEPSDETEFRTAVGVLAVAHPRASGEALTKLATSGLGLLTASLLHMWPSTQRGPELEQLLDISVAAARVDGARLPAAHEVCLGVMRAAARGSVLELLRVCTAPGVPGVGEWLAAHAALLLSRHPRFAAKLIADDTSATVTGEAAIMLKHCHMGLPEFCMLRHAAALLSGTTATWRAVLSCLATCPTAGQPATEEVLSRWPLVADTRGAALQGLRQAALDAGMTHCAASLARTAAFSMLARGHVGLALHTMPPDVLRCHTSACAPVVHLVQAHLRSDLPLSSPDPGLQHLAALIAKVAAEGAGGGMRVPAFPLTENVQRDPGRVWEAGAAYCSLCCACKELADVAGRDAAGVAAQMRQVRRAVKEVKGDIRNAARRLLTAAPMQWVAAIVHKLEPYLHPSAEVFMLEDRGDFMVAVQDSCIDGHGTRLVSPLSLKSTCERLETCMALSAMQ